MIVEIMATTLEDAQIAKESGADRIRLVVGIESGGLTPSYGLIEQVKKKVNIPLHVMIRPHNQSFQYNECDVQTMIRDIEVVKDIGVDGIVIGCLNKDKEIDERVLQLLLHKAKGLDITFNEAFDQLKDQEKGLETLVKYNQITRVCTSGADKSALNGIPQIKKMKRRLKGTTLQILGIKGLKPENLHAFLSVTNVNEVSIGAGVRVNCQYTQPLNSKSVEEAKKIVSKFK
ncbi:copper homeostasis protein CutC [Metabacillus iocasae]|uniref:PF03932 family protein CutC n=1 Tax=Priestia iocasae TaxID=2291674 RepID=A0ABS2QRB1_9BACI|nr:copper homeostasis protein CutC [Metabacillus iocasae]MBM7701984.1 copper homeostasis protein [Metabacillus iocasae]